MRGGATSISSFANHPLSPPCAWRLGLAWLAAALPGGLAGAGPGWLGQALAGGWLADANTHSTHSRNSKREKFGVLCIELMSYVFVSEV